jgi:hypothetical protein
VDTSTGDFTVTFEMVVTSSSAFMIEIGKPRDVYRIAVSGKLASSGRPSALGTTRLSEKLADFFVAHAIYVKAR